MANIHTHLAAAGVANWLDDLSRTKILSGDLARLVDAGEVLGISPLER